MGFFDKWKEKWSSKKEKKENTLEEIEDRNFEDEQEDDKEVEAIQETQEDKEETEEEITQEVSEEVTLEDRTPKEETKEDQKTETSQEKLSQKEIKKQKKKEKHAKKKEQSVEQEVVIYEKGLTKSRKSFTSKLQDLTNRYSKVEDEYFDELEEILIMADIGVETVMRFIDKLKSRVREEKIETPQELKEVIVDELFIIYVSGEILSSKIEYNENGPTVLLFVGVNGVGKTTTIAKLASKMKKEGKKVLLVGGDTFRAGAVAQLKNWSEKIGVDFYGKEEEQVDPASVVFDGVTLGKEQGYDVVLIDTAGRLQNKDNLMRELEKINRVIASIIPNEPKETLLVLDATTGQNGISQAKSFQEITNVTGIVLTKLDGTAKGGIVLAIKEEVGLPVKFIGLGEREEDLQVFDIEKYIYGLFKDFIGDDEND